MAIRISITNITTNNVTLFISGLNTYYTSKRIEVYVDGSYEYEESFTTDSGSAEYSYTTRNILNPSTEYDIYVKIYYYVPGWGQELDGTSNEITFETSGGGGGGGNPTFVASNSGNNIYVEILNYGPNPGFRLFLYDSISAMNNNNYIDDSGIQSGYEYTFYNLSSGTYYIECHFIDDNLDWVWLQDDNTGLAYATVSIGGSSSTPTFTVSISGNNVTVNINNSISSSQFYADLYYQSPRTNLYEQSPLTQGSQYTFYNVPNGTYYLYVFYQDNNMSWTWIYYYGTTSVEKEIVVNNSGPSSNWDYSLDNNYTITSTRSISESVSNYNGKRFRVQFSYDGQAMIYISGGSGYIYITDSYYDWNPSTGAPYTDNSQTQEAIGSTSWTTNVTSSHGYYTIWVRGETGSYSGTITVTIVPPDAPVVNTGYVYIYTGSGTSQGWKKAKPYIYMGSSQGWKPASAYIYNGSTWKITKE